MRRCREVVGIPLLVDGVVVTNDLTVNLRLHSATVNGTNNPAVLTNSPDAILAIVNTDLWSQRSGRPKVCSEKKTPLTSVAVSNTNPAVISRNSTVSIASSGGSRSRKNCRMARELSSFRLKVRSTNLKLRAPRRYRASSAARVLPMSECS